MNQGDNITLNKGRTQSWEELVKKDKHIVEKICEDDKFAYYFFHDKCRPLFSKILWTIYGNDYNYDELVNEMYLQLKKPDAKGEIWHSLKTFDYRTSLFDWIKTVAVRHFYTPSIDVFMVPDTLINTGLAEEMFCNLEKAIYRKYMIFKYIEQLEDVVIAEKIKINTVQLSSLSRKAIRQLKRVVENNYPEYLNSLFHRKDISTTSIENVNESNLPYRNEMSVSHIDILNYLDLMPNERYRTVIKSLFIDDKEPKVLAEEMHTPISNIYNLKSRGLDQLRDALIFHKEIENITEYIALISNDIYRSILNSIFIMKQSYEEICIEFGLSEIEFKRYKKEATKELKAKIFNKSK